MPTPVYNSVLSRDASNDPLVDTPVSANIIQELPTQSAVLQRAAKVQMSSSTQRMPVLSALPFAYFVSGDTGLKQTTNLDWSNVMLVVEEIATIVPIPEAYLSDAQMPIWPQVQPRLVEAIGRLIDAAVLFGTSKPTTWSPAIVPAAIAAGNVVTAGSQFLPGSTTVPADIGVNIAALNQRMSLQGFNVNGFVSRPGFGWHLVAARSPQGLPIYQPDLQNGGTGNVYGYPINEVKNGGWDSTQADMVAGDWSKAIVGVRQDISYKIFTEGVISDADGKVLLNLMQQDSVAMRVTMRMAFATANPVNALQPTAATRYPFGVLAPDTAAMERQLIGIGDEGTRVEPAEPVAANGERVALTGENARAEERQAGGVTGPADEGEKEPAHRGRGRSRS